MRFPCGTGLDHRMGGHVTAGFACSDGPPVSWRASFFFEHRSTVVTAGRRRDRSPEVGATASSTSPGRFAVHLHTYARPSRRAFMARVGGRRVPGAGCDRFRPPNPYPVDLAVPTPASAFRAHMHRPIVARTFAVVVCACRVDRVGVSDQNTYVCRCLGACTCTSFGCACALHGIRT